MIEPLQVTVVQPEGYVKLALDCLQLLATVFLGFVAIKQAAAAREQAATARLQSQAAETQARAAHAELKQSIRPRLVPSQWLPHDPDPGGKMRFQNVGKGAAYAIRWRFDHEWHWTDGEDLVSGGDHTTATVLNHIAGRRIVVEYCSLDEEIFSTTVDPKDLFFICTEPDSPLLLGRLRAKQQGR